MITANALVLLSGGLDSSAALWWAKDNYQAVQAIMFDYGQANRDQELSAAGWIAGDVGIRPLRLAISDSMPRGKGILNRIDDHDGRTDGVSPAFVPGRNVVFLSIAAAHSTAIFPTGNIALVIGANADDARRFPDCRAGTLQKMGEVFRHGVGRQIDVVAPWQKMTKAQALASLKPDALASVGKSWSCYRGPGPCGKCGACVVRAEAFASVGMVDPCAPIVMGGGDRARERA